MSAPQIVQGNLSLIAKENSARDEPGRIIDALITPGQPVPVNLTQIY
jgi:hypothetical protein